ncbi:keratin-associated protein family, partial [Trichomonas vaginalis G3]|uniref:keratin-associated protein family n=1 Tax=Trichomonas vaginalis (strain ATCC PRA-98 / G3) TaxID=412133 RepID=UPI0021E5416B
MNKVLKSHKHSISDINELQATLDSKADKNHTHKSFTTVRADDIILNFDLGSSAPLENPSTSVKDTLNNLDKSCRNIEDHARNFEAYELPTMLDKKADKNHTHKSFTTVRADDIILNFDLGSSAPLENPSTSVKDTLNNLDKSCRNIEDHARNFEAYELPTMLDKKADKTELQTLKTEILQTLYPIGSIYTSMNSTNPETVLGFGTWQQI